MTFTSSGECLYLNFCKENLNIKQEGKSEGTRNECES